LLLVLFLSRLSDPRWRMLRLDALPQIWTMQKDNTPQSNCYMKDMRPVPIKKLTRSIVRAFHPEKIILFGSRAGGFPDRDSDIDLLVIMESGLPAGRRAAEIYRQLGPRHFSLDILVYTPREIKERLAGFDPFLEGILKKGRVLYEAG